jgi:hypothetical protein
MHGRRSLNLELIPLDPNIDRTLRRARRATVVSEIRGEMGGQQDNIPENVEQPIFENENARAENGEQARAWHVDFITSLQELFTPVATSSHLCIMLPPTNATHFDLKLQLLPSFHGLDNENPMAMLRNSKTYVPHSNFKTFLRSLSTLDFSLSLFTIESGHGWIPTCPGLLHLGKVC